MMRRMKTKMNIVPSPAAPAAVASNYFVVSVDVGVFMFNGSQLRHGKVYSTELTPTDAASTAKFLLTRLVIPAITFIKETIQGTTPAPDGATLKGQLRLHFDTGMSPVKEALRMAELGADGYAARLERITNWFDEAMFVISWLKGFLNKEETISWLNAANVEILLLASPEQADNTVRLDGTSCPGVVHLWRALEPAMDVICSGDADALFDYVDDQSEPLVAYGPRIGTDGHLEAEIIHPQCAMRAAGISSAALVGLLYSIVGGDVSSGISGIGDGRVVELARAVVDHFGDQTDYAANAEEVLTWVRESGLVAADHLSEQLISTIAIGATALQERLPVALAQNLELAVNVMQANCRYTVDVNTNVAARVDFSLDFAAKMASMKTAGESTDYSWTAAVADSMAHFVDPLLLASLKVKKSGTITAGPPSKLWAALLRMDKFESRRVARAASGLAVVGGDDTDVGDDDEYVCYDTPDDVQRYKRVIKVQIMGPDAHRVVGKFKPGEQMYMVCTPAATTHHVELFFTKNPNSREDAEAKAEEEDEEEELEEQEDEEEEREFLFEDDEMLEQQQQEEELSELVDALPDATTATVTATAAAPTDGGTETAAIPREQTIPRKRRAGENKNTGKKKQKSKSIQSSIQRFLVRRGEAGASTSVDATTPVAPITTPSLVTMDELQTAVAGAITTVPSKGARLTPPTFSAMATGRNPSTAPANPAIHQSEEIQPRENIDDSSGGGDDAVEAAERRFAIQEAKLRASMAAIENIRRVAEEEEDMHKAIQYSMRTSHEDDLRRRSSARGGDAGASTSAAARMAPVTAPSLLAPDAHTTEEMMEWTPAIRTTAATTTTTADAFVPTTEEDAEDQFRVSFFFSPVTGWIDFTCMGLMPNKIN